MFQNIFKHHVQFITSYNFHKHHHHGKDHTKASTFLSPKVCKSFQRPFLSQYLFHVKMVHQVLRALSDIHKLRKYYRLKSVSDMYMSLYLSHTCDFVIFTLSVGPTPRIPVPSVNILYMAITLTSIHNNAFMVFCWIVKLLE